MTLELAQEAQTICFYKVGDAFGELSNFSRHEIIVDGWLFRSSEHYYQSRKFFSGVSDKVRRAKLCKQAWSIGNAHPTRDDWDSVKDDVMRTALYCKFTQHSALRTLLLSTGDAELVENTPRDSYWGNGGDGKGLNRLGKLLMELRDELNGTRKPKLDLGHEQGQIEVDSGLRIKSPKQLSLDEAVFKRSPVNVLRLAVELSKAQQWQYLDDDSRALLTQKLKGIGLRECSPDRFFELFKFALTLEDPSEPYRQLQNFGAEVPQALSLLNNVDNHMIRDTLARTRSPKVMLALTSYCHLINTAKLNKHGQLLSPGHEGQVLHEQLYIEPEVSAFIRHVFCYIEVVQKFDELSDRKREQLMPKLYPESLEEERLDLMLVWKQIIQYQDF